MTLIVLCIAWLAGIYLGTLSALPFEVGVAIAVTSAIIALLWWSNVAARLTALAVAALIVAAMRSAAALPAAEPRDVAQYNDQGPLYLRGVVADSPVPRDLTMDARLDVRAVKRTVESDWQEIDGGVLLRLPRQPAREYGDELEVLGALETPPDFDLFSYRTYLARQGIAGIMRYPKVTLLDEGQGWAPLAALYRLRRSMGSALAVALPEPQASLAQGILLGQRTAIPTEVNEAFRRTSTTHIIAISGTNVTLLAGLLLLTGRRLFGRAGATAFAILGIAAFAALVGSAPSVLRASAMGIVFAAGSYLGRPRDVTSALALAAALMTLSQPAVLFDLGFQLSVLATAGLILIASPLQRKLSWLPRWLGALLAVTIAAEVATVPIIASYTGQLSLIGPLANLIVPPLLPAVMFSSAATAVGGLLWPPLGQMLGYVAWLFLSLMIWSVETLGAVPWATLPIGRLGNSFIVAYYALLIVLLTHHLHATTGIQIAWRAIWSKIPTAPMLTSLAIGAALCWSAALSAPTEELRISVIDVGQGDAILIRTPEHKILIDGGPSPEAIANALGRRLPFWDMGLDLVVLTHPNEDHMAGLTTVLERFSVQQVMDTGLAGGGSSYQRWQELIKAKAIKHHTAHAGQTIDLGQGITLRLLHPSGPLLGTEDPNEASIVLRLNAGRFSLLLTGDIGPAAAASLLESGEELRSTVLKVPHHGSRTGLSPALLDSISPEIAIISAGRDNRFGHPAQETLTLLQERGARIYRTDLNGTTEVVLAAEGYQIQTER